MDTPEQPADKQPSCSCYNQNRRPCQYEVLYDEALCQVESLQRQVRHLRTEMRRVEDENAVLIQQMNKHSSEPQQDVSQLKMKHENEMKKREESWQRELQRWRKKFQIRDAEITTLKARIAELEGESRKPTSCKAVQAEVRCATDAVPVPAENTLEEKNDSSSTAKVSAKSSNACATATDKSYEDIMDELFGASPKPDVPENMDYVNNSDLVKQSTESKGTKMKEQAKKAASKSLTKDEVQAVSVGYLKKDVDICSKEPSKIIKHSTTKSSGGATVNKDIPKSSSSKTSVPCLNTQKTGSELKAKDISRNVFDKMKMHSKECVKDNQSSFGASSFCHSEKQTVTQDGELCKDGKKKSTSTKEVTKVSPVGQKVKKPGSSSKTTLLQDVQKSNKVELEQQKTGSAENLKTLKVAVDQNCKRKLLDSGVSADTKEQNIQKRIKPNSADKAGSLKLKDFERLEQKKDGIALDDNLPSSHNNDKPVSNKKSLPSGPARKDNKRSSSSVTKIAVESKPEMVNASKVYDIHQVSHSKMDKKPVNLSDFERVKAYMNLADRIKYEKKQANQPEKVKSVSSTSRQNCMSPSLSSDFDDSRHVNETSQEYHPSSSCYSPSVLPVKEDEYDPFNPGIDVFPMSKYNIQKSRFGATKKYPVLQQSVLRIDSKPEMNKDDRKMTEAPDLHEEYTPTSISRTSSDEKQVEPVEYIPSSMLYSSKKHSPRSSPLLGHPPPPSHLTLENKATKVHPSASSTACFSLPTTVPNPDQLMTASKPSLLNESLQKKSPPLSSHSFVPVESVSTNESNITSDNTFKEASVTTKSGVVLPQLNLSCIGDNLLSGVREALNMVKTLSPQIHGQGDDPASKPETKSSEEQQPPLLLSKKKDVAVLMPSPLKKPPKDNDNQLLHAKILSSMQLDEGNCRENSVQKCANPKVSQSVRLWRKRKRTTTAEPKSILKKSRSITGDGVEGDGCERCSSDHDLVCNRQNCRISSLINASSVQVAAVHDAAAEAGEVNNNSRECGSLLHEAPPSLEVEKSKGIQKSKSEGSCDSESVCNKLCETDVSKMQQHDKGYTSVHIGNDMAGSKIDKETNVETLIDHPQRTGEKFTIERGKEPHCNEDYLQARTHKLSSGVHMAAAETVVGNVRNDLGNGFKNQFAQQPSESKKASLPGADGQKLLNDKIENEHFDVSSSLTYNLLQQQRQGNANGKTSSERLSSSVEKDHIKCPGTSGRVNPKTGDEMSYCRTKHKEGKECDGSVYAVVSLPKAMSAEAMDTSLTTLDLSGDDCLNDVSVSSSATSGSSHLAAEEMEHLEAEASPQTVFDQAAEKNGVESRVLVYNNDDDGTSTGIAEPNSKEPDARDTTRLAEGMKAKMPGDITDGNDAKDQLCSISDGNEHQSPAIAHGSEKSASWQMIHDSTKLSTSPNPDVKPNTFELVMPEDSIRDKLKRLSPPSRNGASDKSSSAPLTCYSDSGCEVSSIVGPILGLTANVDGLDPSCQLEKVAIKQEVSNSDDDCGKVKRVQEVRGSFGSTSPASIIVLSDDDSSSSNNSSGSSSASSCLSSEEESESGNQISQGEQVEQSSSGSDGEERTNSECQANNPDDSSSDAHSGSECSTGSNCRTSESNASSCCDDEKESGIEQMDSEPEEGMEEEQTGGQDNSSSCSELDSSNSSCCSCCNSNSGSSTGSDVQSSRADADQMTEDTASVQDTDESANQETSSSENKASVDKTSKVSVSSEHGSQLGDDVLMELQTSHNEDVVDLFTGRDNDFKIGSIPDGKPKTNSTKCERRHMSQTFSDCLQDGMISSATHCGTWDNKQKGFKRAIQGSRSAIDAKFSIKKTVTKETDRLATTKEQHVVHAGISQRRSVWNDRSQSNSKRPYNVDQLPRSDSQSRFGTETERRPNRLDGINNRSDTHRTSTERATSDTNRNDRPRQTQSHSHIRK